jgi:hypothetical protein
MHTGNQRDTADLLGHTTNFLYTSFTRETNGTICCFCLEHFPCGVRLNRLF